jgi:hypothetical protein
MLKQSDRCREKQEGSAEVGRRRPDGEAGHAC